MSHTPVLRAGRDDDAPPVLRAGRDSDASDFIALVDTCWAEYPGCVMDLDGEVPELRALATYYAQQNGALWAAGRAGRVVGMVATKPLADGTWELCKMYAYADQRGTGLAQSLVTAAAVSALPRLSRLAAAPWKSIASQAATGAAILLVAWHEGALIGTAVLETPSTQPHRAALGLLLVAPEARRQGIGRALLRATEAAAKSVGRDLLTATTGRAEDLFLAEAWHRLGTIAGYTSQPDGTRESATFLWKPLT